MNGICRTECLVKHTFILSLVYKILLIVITSQIVPDGCLWLGRITAIIITNCQRSHHKHWTLIEPNECCWRGCEQVLLHEITQRSSILSVLFIPFFCPETLHSVHRIGKKEEKKKTVKIVSGRFLWTRPRSSNITDLLLYWPTFSQMVILFNNKNHWKEKGCLKEEEKKTIGDHWYYFPSD